MPLTKHNENSIDVVIAGFNYLDSFKFLEITKFLFEALLYTGSICLIITFIIYSFLLYNSKNKKAFKNFWGNQFTKMCMYYPWILQYPFQTIFLSIVVCQENLFTEIGLKCYDDKAILAFAIIGLFLNTLICTWLTLFFYKIFCLFIIFIPPHKCRSISKEFFILIADKNVSMIL